MHSRIIISLAHKRLRRYPCSSVLFESAQSIKKRIYFCFHRKERDSSKEFNMARFDMLIHDDRTFISSFLPQSTQFYLFSRLSHNFISIYVNNARHISIRSMSTFCLLCQPRNRRILACTAEALLFEDYSKAITFLSTRTDSSKRTG